MSNLSRIQSRLRELNVPAILLTDMASVRWATGFTGTSGQVLVTQTEGVFLTDSRYTIQAQEQVKDMPSDSFAAPKKGLDFLKEHVSRLGIQEMGFEPESVTVDQHMRWQESFNGLSLKPVRNFVGPIRAVKLPHEVDAIRKACKLTDACYEHLRKFIRSGMTEMDVVEAAEVFYKSHGSTAAFPIIAVSGDRSARPHGMPSDKLLQEGDFLTIDMGAKVDGYAADMTRTFVIGKATDRHREVYDQVLKAQEATWRELKPGANGRDVDGLARQILDEKGLAQYFGHGLGHGLGLLVHDAGRLSMHEDQPIEAGQVWTVEPGVYIEGFGGVRIEDDVLVTQNGPENLCSFTKELLVLG